MISAVQNPVSVEKSPGRHGEWRTRKSSDELRWELGARPRREGWKSACNKLSCLNLNGIGVMDLHMMIQVLLFHPIAAVRTVDPLVARELFVLATNSSVFNLTLHNTVSYEDCSSSTRVKRGPVTPIRIGANPITGSGQRTDFELLNDAVKDL